MRIILHGIVVMDKPRGRTSHDMVAFSRHLLRQKRIGHTGTLDPLATGVLPLCLGEATRLAQYLTNQHKVYEAEVLLGVTSKTYDIEGDLREVAPSFFCTRNEMENALAVFCGVIEQKPPLYSAVSIAGKRLYQQARLGIEVDIPTRIIHIEQLKLKDREEQFYAGTPFAINVHCSKGTYIRSLVHDLGLLLGCGAVVSGLRRLQSGHLAARDALSPEQMESFVSQGRSEALLYPLNPEMFELPWLSLDSAQREELSHGRTFAYEHELIKPNDEAITSFEESYEVMLLDSSNPQSSGILGIGICNTLLHLIKPQKVFNNPIAIMTEHVPS